VDADAEFEEVTKSLPDLITVAGWHGCDHTGPVREGDTLTSEITVESAGGARVVHLRVHVQAYRSNETTDVLDWRPVFLSR
jgi:acyl dehydratase